MDWNKARELIDAAQRVLVVTHISPDGDAIGSLLGMGHALRKKGKTVTVGVDGGVPKSMRFLPSSSDIVASLPDGFQADLFITVDCGDAERTGKIGARGLALGVPSLNLDHHRTNTLFANLNLVDLSTVAASEGVLDLCDHLEIAVTPEIAQCLLCGIVTDTLCFRTNNVTAVILGKAQRLMAAGANLSEIVQNTINHVSEAALKLWKQVMPTVCLEDHVIWASISLGARRDSGYIDGEDGGLVSWLIQSEGAYISCVLREKADSLVDISLRAVPGFDVSAYAVSVGGGGHSLAAGALIKGSLAEVEAQIIPALKALAQTSQPQYK